MDLSRSDELARLVERTVGLELEKTVLAVFAAAQGKEFDREIKHLVMELKNKEIEIARLNVILIDSKGAMGDVERKDLQDKLKRKIKENEGLMSNLAVTSGILKTSEEEKEEKYFMQGFLEQICAEIITDWEEKIADLQCQIESADVEQNMLKDRLSDEQQNNNKLTEKIEELEKQMKAEKAEKAELQIDCVKQRKEIADLDAEQNILKKILEGLDNMLKLKEEILMAKAENTVFRIQKEELQTNWEKQTKEIADLDAKQNILKEKLSEEQQNNNKLKEKIEELEKQMKAEKAKLQSDCVKQSKEIAERDAKQKEKIEELEKQMKAEKAELQSDCVKKSKEIAKLQSRVESAVGESETWKDMLKRRLGISSKDDEVDWENKSILGPEWKERRSRHLQRMEEFNRKGARLKEMQEQLDLKSEPFWLWAALYLSIAVAVFLIACLVFAIAEEVGNSVGGSFAAAT